MAKGVVFPPSFYEAIKGLEPHERLAEYEAVLEYGLNGRLPNLSPALNGYFLLMQPFIDASQRRYATAVENGKKGGAPKGNQNAAKHMQPENNQTDNHDNESDYDTASVSVYEKGLGSCCNVSFGKGKKDAGGKPQLMSPSGSSPTYSSSLSTGQEFDQPRDEKLKELTYYSQGKSWL